MWDMKNHPHWLLTTLAKRLGTPPRLKPLSKQSKQQPQMPLREPVSLRPAGRSQGHGFTPCRCQHWGCTWTTRSCAWLMGLHLGVSLCHPHKCHLCGAGVDHQGTHGHHCQRSLGHHPRHMAINDLIKRCLATAKIVAHLEPAEIFREDGKRPDGAKVMPWKGG